MFFSPHSSVIQLCNHLGPSLSYFELYNVTHILMGDRSSTCTLWLQPCCCNVQKLIWCFHVKISMDITEKGSICCSKRCSVSMMPSLMCRLPTNTPCIWQTLAFELYTGNNLDGPFLLWPGEHDFQYLRIQSERLTRHITKHVSTIHHSISHEL